MSPFIIVCYFLTALFVVFLLLKSHRSKRKSTFSIAHLPGPEPDSFWHGNIRQLMREQVGRYDVLWQETYGMVVRFRAPLGEDRLWISDPKAIRYILQTSRYHFEKPYAARFVLNTATGKGLNGAEGQDHYRQRRALLPAFGAAETRALRPIFTDSAHELVRQFRDACAEAKIISKELDVSGFLGHAILDGLGKAAFAYDFNGLDERKIELEKSLHNFMARGFGLPSDWKVFLQGVMVHVPPRILGLMTYFPSSGLTFLRRHVRLSNDVARTLIAERREDADRRDALSIIVKANRFEDERRRLADEEIIPQLATILGAGYETTTNSLGWILLELARHPTAQERLRDEIRVATSANGAGSVNPDNLSFLNAVIKETLRFDTVVPHVFRVSTRDDVIPLSQPVAGASELAIAKGTHIVISDVAYNRNRDIWGSDAGVWRPERWLDGTVNSGSAHVGVLGNLMSFGTGHRACLGWRFALVELQAFMVELVAHLRFEMTVRAERIRGENCLVMLPMVAGEEACGNQLPLRVSLVGLDDD